MRLPNGYVSVYKKSGKRRKPWAVRKTIGWTDDEKQIFAHLGTFRTREEAMKALAAYNANPFDLQSAKLTFSDIYERWVKEEYGDGNPNKNYITAYNLQGTL